MNGETCAVWAQVLPVLFLTAVLTEASIGRVMLDMTWLSGGLYLLTWMAFVYLEVVLIHGVQTGGYGSNAAPWLWLGATFLAFMPALRVSTEFGYAMRARRDAAAAPQVGRRPLRGSSRPPRGPRTRR